MAEGVSAEALKPCSATSKKVEPKLTGEADGEDISNLRGWVGTRKGGVVVVKRLGAEARLNK